MTKDWLLPLITSVVGLLGALIGTGGAIYFSRRSARAARLLALAPARRT